MTMIGSPILQGNLHICQVVQRISTGGDSLPSKFFLI